MEPRSLRLASLEVHGLRNLVPAQIRLGPRFNVFAGNNAQGKTNLLEAVYLACTSKSFRVPSLDEVVRHGESTARVTATFDVEDEPKRVQVLSFGEGGRTTMVDGKRVRSLSAYAALSPVVVFEPRSLALTQGPSGERRRLLDRVGFHLAVVEGGAATAVEDLTRYRQALARRRRALVRGDDVRVLGALEEILSVHGAAIAARRARTLEALRGPVVDAFARISRGSASLEIALASRGPRDREGLVEALRARRGDDARRGTTTVGPHLDDLELVLSGHAVRHSASQGQHRMLVLSLVSAELQGIAAAREVAPILLLDDVSSELDPTRNAALFDFLDGTKGQVLVTTTRPEALSIRTERLDFRVEQGKVEP